MTLFLDLYILSLSPSLFLSLLVPPRYSLPLCWRTRLLFKVLFISKFSSCPGVAVGDVAGCRRMLLSLSLLLLLPFFFVVVVAVAVVVAVVI